MQCAVSVNLITQLQGKIHVKNKKSKVDGKIRTVNICLVLQEMPDITQF